MQEVLNAARTINTERTKTNIIRMILDNSDDAMAEDETGRLLEANGQAYRLYRLAFLSNWQGRPIQEVNEKLTFIGNRAAPCRDGEESVIDLGGQEYYVKYKLIREASGTGTLIHHQLCLQDHAGGAAGCARAWPARRSCAKYTFRDIIAEASPRCKRRWRSPKSSARPTPMSSSPARREPEKELFAHSIHSASGRK